MDFKNIIWDENGYNTYIDYLKDLSDGNIKEFNTRIFNDKKEILGIKIPILRDVAKEILSGNVEEFLLLAKSHDEFVEEVMIEGFIIASFKEDFEEKISRIDAFIPKISSWAICDSFVPSLKCVNKNKDRFFKYLMNKYNEAKSEFELRFIIISLMDYYIESDKLDILFKVFDDVKKEDYYVKMAVAWAISVSFVKYRNETLKYIENSKKLDDFTFNKAIDKCRDSFRVSKEDKEYLKTIKRAGK